MNLRVLASLVMVAMMVSCSSGHSGADPDSVALPVVSPDGVDNPLAGEGIEPTASSSTAEQIRVVEEAPVPPDVDPLLFEELRAELIRVVAARQSTVPDCYPAASWLLPPGLALRSVSFTPYGVVNRIDDLKLRGDGPFRITWTYRNRGDYDLNGMVNVSDLTPVGIYYGKTSADPLWYYASAADGDGNGMITVADITPLGQYFGGTILGYRVWGTDSPDQAWNHIGDATVATNLRKNPLRPRFVINVPTLDYKYYAVWPYDNSDDEGGWSNMTFVGQHELLEITGMESLW